MSRENVEIIRRSYEIYYATGELPWDLLDSDVEVRDFDLPDAVGEVFRGHEGYQRWVSLWSTAWEEWELALEELVDAGDRVVAIFGLRATGKGSGIETERMNGAVFTVRDGKVTRCDYFGSKEAALAAAQVRDPQRTA